MIRIRAMFVCGILLQLSQLSCGDSAGPRPKAGEPALVVRVSGDAQHGTVGTALPLPLVVLVKDQHGDAVPNVAVRWSSSGAGAAFDPAQTVTDAGGITRTVWSVGHTAGVDSAIAQVGAHRVSFSATALAGPAAALRPAADSMLLVALGDTMSLVTTAVDAFGNRTEPGAITYRMLDDSIATISSGGVVSAVREGRTSAQVSMGGVVMHMIVRVAQVPARVRILGTITELVALGDSIQLNARVEDRNGHVVSRPRLQWLSAHGTVASVDSGGTVIARGNGTTTITLRAGAASDSVSVKVAQRAVSLELPSRSYVIQSGGSVEVAARALDARGFDVPVARDTRNVNVVRVENARAVGALPGRAHVIVRALPLVDSAQVTVLTNMTSPAFRMLSPLPTGMSLNTLAVAPDGTAFAAGRSGVVLHYDGADWSVFTPSRNTFQTRYGDAIQDIAVNADSEFFLLNTAGHVRKLAGGTWSNINGPVDWLANRHFGWGKQIWAGRRDSVYIVEENAPGIAALEGTLQLFESLSSLPWSKRASANEDIGHGLYLYPKLRVTRDGWAVTPGYDNRGITGTVSGYGLWKLRLRPIQHSRTSWQFLPLNVSPAGIVADSGSGIWILKSNAVIARDDGTGALLDLPAPPLTGTSVRFGGDALVRGPASSLLAAVATVKADRTSIELVRLDSTRFTQLGALPFVSGSPLRTVAVGRSDNGDVLLAGDLGVLGRWRNGQWTRIDRRPVDEHLSGVAYSGAAGLAVGYSHYSASWEGRDYGVLLPLDNDVFGTPVFVRGRQHAVWAAGRNTFWSVGVDVTSGKASIVSWDGVRATEEFLAEGTALHGIHGMNREQVWVVGARDLKTRPQTLVMRFDGTRWIDVSPEVQGTLTSVWATSNRVYAGGCSDPCNFDSRPLLLVFDGATWTQLQPAVANSSFSFISAVHGFDDGAVIMLAAAGKFGTPDQIVVSTDHGATWRTEIPLDSRAYDSEATRTHCDTRLWGPTHQQIAVVHCGELWIKNGGVWGFVREEPATFWAVGGRDELPIFVGAGGAFATGFAQPATVSPSMGPAARVLSAPAAAPSRETLLLAPLPWNRPVFD